MSCRLEICVRAPSGPAALAARPRSVSGARARASIGGITTLRGPAEGRRHHRRPAAPPQAILDFFRGGKPASAAGDDKQQRKLAVQRLLGAIEGRQRGLDGSNSGEVLEAVAELRALGEGSTTTEAGTLSATWKLLWTTEKETLFILEKAGWFGTTAGDVFQVIDVEAGSLQNVITFPPEGAFIVDSSIRIESQQRTAFEFRAATLRLPKGRRLQLPPVGKGWFDTIYCDGSLRVAQDSRGDTLVVAREGPPRRFE